MDDVILLTRIRRYIWVMIIGLFLSGLTAFPIESELAWLTNHATQSGDLTKWLYKVYHAVKITNQTYPFLNYGTDWLAFAHVMFAVLFCGALKDPKRNVWIIQFGIIAAIAIFPLAFIAGALRGIPVTWRLVDCSFGVVALLILIPCYHYICKLSVPV